MDRGGVVISIISPSHSSPTNPTQVRSRLRPCACIINVDSGWPSHTALVPASPLGTVPVGGGARIIVGDPKGPPSNIPPQPHPMSNRKRPEEGSQSTERYPPSTFYTGRARNRGWRGHNKLKDPAPFCAVRSSLVTQHRDQNTPGWEATFLAL